MKRYLMIPKEAVVLVVVVSLILLNACSMEEWESSEASPSKAYPTHYNGLGPAGEQTATPKVASSTVTPSLHPSVNTLQDLDRLDCPEEVYSSNKAIQQIIVGMSRDNFLAKFGLPDDSHLDDISYPYDEQFVYAFQDQEAWMSVFLKESVVIVGGIDYYSPDLAPTIEDALSQYGCPHSVFAYDSSEHKNGNWSDVMLIYPELGVVVHTDAYPSNIETPISRLYFEEAFVDSELFERHPELLYRTEAQPLAAGDVLVK